MAQPRRVVGAMRGSIGRSSLLFQLYDLGLSDAFVQRVSRRDVRSRLVPRSAHGGNGYRACAGRRHCSGAVIEPWNSAAFVSWLRLRLSCGRRFSGGSCGSALNH
jgi:hypothetical protein